MSNHFLNASAVIKSAKFDGAGNLLVAFGSQIQHTNSKLDLGDNDSAGKDRMAEGIHVDAYAMKCQEQDVDATADAIADGELTDLSLAIYLGDAQYLKENFIVKDSGGKDKVTVFRTYFAFPFDANSGALIELCKNSDGIDLQLLLLEKAERLNLFAKAPKADKNAPNIPPVDPRQLDLINDHPSDGVAASTVHVAGVGYSFVGRETDELRATLEKPELAADYAAAITAELDKRDGVPTMSERAAKAKREKAEPVVG